MLIQTIHLVEDDLFFAQLIIQNLNQAFPEKEIKHFLQPEQILIDESEPADLFILDYDLNTDKGIEKMNGLELKKELYDMKKVAPVIFLTGMSDISEAVRMLRDHGSDFIVKDQDAFSNLTSSIKDLEEISSLDASSKKIRTEGKDHATGRFIMASALCAIILFYILY